MIRKQCEICNWHVSTNCTAYTLCNEVYVKFHIWHIYNITFGLFSAFRQWFRRYRKNALQNNENILECMYSAQRALCSLFSILFYVCRKLWLTYLLKFCYWTFITVGDKLLYIIDQLSSHDFIHFHRLHSEKICSLMPNVVMHFWISCTLCPQLVHLFDTIFFRIISAIFDYIYHSCFNVPSTQIV